MTRIERQIHKTRALARNPQHRAYDWALDKCIQLEERITMTTRECSDDWWALLRCIWKAKLGLDPCKGCEIPTCGWVPE